jgi:hypothetical protein
MRTRTIRLACLGLLAASLHLPLAAAPARADSGPCPQTDVNGATCHIVTPPPLAGTITVDGQETAGEWTGAITKPLSGPFSGTVKLFRTTTTLYLIIAVTLGPDDPNDTITLYFDPLHNHMTVTDDISFKIVRRTATTLVHSKTTSAGTTQWPPTPGPVRVSTPAASWTAELALPASEFALTDLPPIMGFGVQAEDASSGDLAVWPPGFDSAAPATTWANLKTRYPIQYDIVLDQSGSMLDQNKWADAKTAANFLANTMAVFRDQQYFKDQIGVVTFAWVCNGANITQQAKPLADVGAFPVGDYIAVPPPIADPIGNNCTPIGEGLKTAFAAGALDAATPTPGKERERAVLLLSDGLQNKPGATILPADTGYDPCPGGANWNACPASTPSNVQVNTVAFGTDAGVDSALLSNIKNRYRGEIAAPSNLPPPPAVETLKENFITTLDDLYRLNLVRTDSAPGGAPPDFVVNSGEHKLAVILSWQTPTNAADLVLQRQQGGTFVNVTCNQVGKEPTKVGFSICVLNNPPAGTYHVRATGGGSFTAPPDTQFVVVDLKLSAHFDIDRRVHGTGHDIILTANLRDGGKPLTDTAAHRVNVTAQVERPNEGLGNFVSTHSLRNCRTIRPSLPKYQPDPNLAANLSTVAGAAQLAKQLQQGSAGGADPQPPLYALAGQLLRDCHKSDLARASQPPLKLVDDGSGADAKAKDGIYTARYDATNFEGSYVFRFDASGADLGGKPFTRTQRLAEYVRPEVDAAHSEINSSVLQVVGNTTIKEFFVLPADQFGRYLGPGRADQVDFIADRGEWLTPVIDHGNGYYGRVLRYDQSLGEPSVTPVVQGKPVVKRSSLDLPWWLWLIIALLIVVIIILLLLLLLRRRRQPATP